MRQTLTALLTLVLALSGCVQTASAQPLILPYKAVTLQINRTVVPAPSCYYCGYAYPVEVTEWVDSSGVTHTGSGWFYSYPRAVNIPTRWVPRQACWVEEWNGHGAWWVIQWANPGWVWTHPDDVDIRPFYRTLPITGYSFGTYNLPNGRRFPAHAVTISPAGTGVGNNTTPVTFETKFPQLGGSFNTQRYEALTHPLVFGSCVVSSQSNGAWGDFLGWWQNIDAFTGFTTDNWRTGTFIFGPDPYHPIDFNRDGRVTLQDMFDFLEGYLQSSPRADCNHSGSCEAGDVFEYLSGWFTAQ